MRLEAIVTRDDLERVAKQFAPLKLNLGDGGGTLEIDDPSDIRLVPAVGLHMQCTAHLHWPVLGIKIPITIKPLTVRVLPSIDKREKGDALVLTFQIEHADVAIVPTIIDNEITNLINRELVKNHLDVAWNFADTLTRDIDMPKSLGHIKSLGLHVQAGAVRVSDDALILTISLTTTVHRDDRAHTPIPELATS
ncbi:MAG: hypothetical protein ABI461_01110 [Polyangiaceae bacterium]